MPPLWWYSAMQFQGPLQGHDGSMWLLLHPKDTGRKKWINPMQYYCGDEIETINANLGSREGSGFLDIYLLICYKHQAFM